MNLRSIETIKGEIENYEQVFKETVEILKKIDNALEKLIIDPDENMQYALRDTYHTDEPTTISELYFPHYLPQGKMQYQRQFILDLNEIAKGNSKLDVDEKLTEYLQTVWKSNPLLGTIKIDGTENKMKVQQSLDLLTKYLSASEHEFWKQWLSAKFDRILHEYDMLLQNDETFHDIKYDNKLVDYSKWMLDRSYARARRITDAIYYRRAKDYIPEITGMWKFLDQNEVTKPWLLRMEDFHPNLKSS